MEIMKRNSENYLVLFKINKKEDHETDNRRVEKCPVF